MLARKAVHTALEATEPDFAGPAELALLLTNDDEQRALNKKWRGRDNTTNVLSFPQVESFLPLSALLGDIILARQTVANEAQEGQIPLEHHYVHLVVHGFLHILGYDHQIEEQARLMEGLETQILKTLGVPDPY